jgi:hypothetical protein
MEHQSRFSDDKGFAAAVAHFQTYEGAKEARDLLNGKRNATNDATLIVDLLQDALPGAIGSRRNTVDSSASTRQGSIATGISGATTNGRQASRYNGTKIWRRCPHPTEPRVLATESLPLPTSSRRHHLSTPPSRVVTLANPSSTTKLTMMMVSSMIRLVTLLVVPLRIPIRNAGQRTPIPRSPSRALHRCP